jgi:hypothetical protein
MSEKEIKITGLGIIALVQSIIYYFMEGKEGI